MCHQCKTQIMGNKLQVKTEVASHLPGFCNYAL
jgi:hypothetical protein